MHDRIISTIDANQKGITNAMERKYADTKEGTRDPRATDTETLAAAAKENLEDHFASVSGFDGLISDDAYSTYNGGYFALSLATLGNSYAEGTMLIDGKPASQSYDKPRIMGRPGSLEPVVKRKVKPEDQGPDDGTYGQGGG